MKTMLALLLMTNVAVAQSYDPYPPYRPIRPRGHNSPDMGMPDVYLRCDPGRWVTYEGGRRVWIPPQCFTTRYPRY